MKILADSGQTLGSEMNKHWLIGCFCFIVFLINYSFYMKQQKSARKRNLLLTPENVAHRGGPQRRKFCAICFFGPVCHRGLPPRGPFV